MRPLLAAVLAGWALAACGSPAPPAAEIDVVAEATAAYDRSDWVPAARLLREAIVKEPYSVRLHYFLAVAATHLELRDEAVREFRWVVANAPKESPEAEAARNWLAAAGVLVAASTPVANEPPVAVDPMAGDSTLRGQIVWGDGEPPVKITRLQLFLKGEPGTPIQDFMRVMRTDENGRFEFRNIPAGSYKFSNRIAGAPVWRLRVNVPAAQEVTLDLTAQNSLRARDDFPQDGK